MARVRLAAPARRRTGPALLCWHVRRLSLTGLACLALYAETTVPFRGCPADGQAGPQEAPVGAPVRVAISATAAVRLAYYNLGPGTGVLAPRGWHCIGLYGSSGVGLVVSAQPINGDNFFSKDMAELRGPLIVLDYLDSSGSGSWHVALMIARVVSFAHGIRQKTEERVRPAGE